MESSLPVHSLKYEGRLSKIFALCYVNILLSILTLGIYSFYGKTKLRKYIATNFSIAENRFEYTGTGTEILLGFLKVLPLVILFYGGFSYALFLSYSNDNSLWVAPFFIALIFLGSLSYYLALGYRFSRTTYMGIRGSIKGSALEYACMVLLYLIVDILTLGLLSPYTDTKLYKYIVNNASFGTTQMQFKGNPQQLVKVNLITLLLAIPTLGISRLWYICAKARFFLSNIYIDNIRFNYSIGTGRYIYLLITNLLILQFTLGLGAPIIIHRNMKYLSQYFSLVGELELAKVRQSNEQLTNSGEGLDQAFGDGGIEVVF